MKGTGFRHLPIVKVKYIRVYIGRRGGTHHQFKKKNSLVFKRNVYYFQEKKKRFT